jgi:hypothetical protein
MERHLRVANASALLVGLALLIVETGRPSSFRAQALAALGEQSSRPTFPKDSPYHKHPPKGPLPPTLDPAQFKQMPRAYVAYSLAATIKEVLYQEPCFCGCRKSAGHESLLDCYTARHAQFCGMCQYEAIFCYEQHKRGKSAKQIRKAMVKHQWGHLDLDKYARDYEIATQGQN